MIETDATGAPYEVDDLDAATLLAHASTAETAARAAERRKLRLVAHWCVLHPATPETGCASWGDPRMPGLAPDESLGGEGTPAVAAFTPEPFAAALGVSTLAGMALLADTLDLVHRLPRLWAAVDDLAVPGWQARRIAQATRHLSRSAAAYVDNQLDGRAHRATWPTIQRHIEAAAAQFDPEEHAEREIRRSAGWHVTLTHGHPTEGFDATSHLDITGDTTDLTRFHDLVCDQAQTLGRLGDTSPWEVRKAKAIGVIAGTQTSLDLAADLTDPLGNPVTAVTTRRDRVRLYLHLSPDQWAAHLHGDVAVGQAERLGPVTTTRIAEWLAGAQVTVRPVVDLARSDGIDPHDPPPWMRDAVLLRDPHCVFPDCSRPSRDCDLDHIDAYDEHGPPGQTRPDNLAPLCRRHHRLKTSGVWSYRRTRDGTYLWRSPETVSFAVTPDGTLTL